MSTPPTIRFACLEDIPTILTFIKAAAVEQAPDAVVEATEASLADTRTATTTTTPRFAYPLFIVSPDNTPAGVAIPFSRGWRALASV